MYPITVNKLSSYDTYAITLTKPDMALIIAPVEEFLS